jgi:hypothetical protein
MVMVNGEREQMGTFDRMAKMLIVVSFVAGVSLIVGAQLHALL